MNTALMTKMFGAFLLLLCLYYVFMFFRYKRQYQNNKVATKRTLFLIIPVLILFVLLEIVCRTLVANKVMKTQAHFLTRYCATAYYIKSLKYDDYKPRYIRLREQRPDYTVDENFSSPEIEGTHHCRMQSDSDGFILPECCGGANKIFFIGGSTTECMLVSEDKRFPYLVAKALQQKNLVYTVKNAGVAGNNTFHNLNTLLNKVLAYKPKMVVGMEAINDLTALLYENAYHNSNPFKGLIVDENKTEVDAHSEDEFYLKRGYRKISDTAAILKEYKTAIKLFINICRGADAQPVLMTQFNRIDSSNIGSCKMLDRMLGQYAQEFPGLNVINIYKQMNQVMRQTALEQNVPLIDLDLAVPKTEKYMYDIVHLNDIGSVYVSGIISGRLIELLSNNKELPN